MKIDFSSQRREMLLFLTANMAAVMSRANHQLVRHFIFIPHSEFTILVNTDLILCCSQFLFGKS